MVDKLKLSSGRTTSVITMRNDTEISEDSGAPCRSGRPGSAARCWRACSNAGRDPSPPRSRREAPPICRQAGPGARGEDPACRDPVRARLIGAEEADVAAGAAGKVIATYVERGSVVRKGALLAKLDARAASATAAQAAAELEVQKAQAAQAAAGLRAQPSGCSRRAPSRRPTTTRSEPSARPPSGRSPRPRRAGC